MSVSVDDQHFHFTSSEGVALRFAVEEQVDTVALDGAAAVTRNGCAVEDGPVIGLDVHMRPVRNDRGVNRDDANLCAAAGRGMAAGAGGVGGCGTGDLLADRIGAAGDGGNGVSTSSMLVM